MMTELGAFLHFQNEAKVRASIGSGAFEFGLAVELVEMVAVGHLAGVEAEASLRTGSRRTAETFIARLVRAARELSRS